MTLELPPKAREKLENVGRDTDQSLSEVIRRAISLYERVGTALMAGDQLVIRSGDRETEILLTEFDVTPAPAPKARRSVG